MQSTVTTEFQGLQKRAMIAVLLFPGCSSYAIIREQGTFKTQNLPPLVEIAKVIDGRKARAADGKWIGTLVMVPQSRRDDRKRKLREGKHSKVMRDMMISSRKEAAQRGATSITLSDDSRFTTEIVRPPIQLPFPKQFTKYKRRLYSTELRVTLYRRERAKKSK